MAELSMWSASDAIAREYDMNTLTNFYDRLARLKWHRIILGDDWQTVREHTMLRSEAGWRGGPFQELFDAFSRYHSSGPAFGTERAPMPQRPSGQLTIV